MRRFKQELTSCPNSDALFFACDDDSGVEIFQGMWLGGSALNGSILSISIIAHESLHAAIHTLRLVGIKLEECSEEAYTYLHQYIMMEIMRKVMLYVKKTSNK